MRNILFNDSLEFEINLIGYSEKGESIVFFLRTDGKVVYSGLVDCYELRDENKAVELLRAEERQYFDFICWTHPHDDHTLGLNTIINEYCDEHTNFWMPQISLMDKEQLSEASKDLYGKIFENLESKKKNKIKIREVINCCNLEKIMCSGNSTRLKYNFEIVSFAPDSNLLLQSKARDLIDNINLYSIGLFINVGAFCILLAGDIENRMIKFLPEDYLEYDIDYLKIPHHASESSSALIDILKRLNKLPPKVATTTVYRRHKLPDQNVLNKYLLWRKDMEVYSSGACYKELDKTNVGIIKTSFDILERREYQIETSLEGNSISISKVNFD